MATFVDYMIGLGSNLGSRQASLETALELLDATQGCSVTRRSSLYESEPVGGPPQPRYLNAAARVASTLEPHAFLRVLLAIEKRLGRQRRERWGPRTIDLDMLWAAQRVTDAELCVPHPRLCERSFALAPLLEVAAELEPQYGPALATVHGPALLRRSWHPLRAHVYERGAGLELDATACDLADAAAAALSALGRRFWSAPTCVASEARVVLASGAHGQELADFVAQVLSHAARGFEFRSVTLGALDDGRVEAVLFGRVVERAGPRLLLASASHRALADGARLVLSLVPETRAPAEHLAFLPQIPDS
jgi:2-amino-4-hydroxy-6-hydroxymethyldihydropteridine diphosphokinase